MRRIQLTAAGLLLILAVLAPAAQASLDHGSRASVAWALGYTGAGQSIAVIDTGVNAKHSWFDGGSITEEACFSLDNGVLRPLCGGGVPAPQEAFGPGAAMPKTRYGSAAIKDGHGTLVTGTAVGAEKRIYGLPAGGRGMAPDASAIGIKASVWRPPGITEMNMPATGRALRWLDENLDERPLAVVNLSFGFRPESAGEVKATDGNCDAAARRDLRTRNAQAAITDLVAHGVTVVAAAGNRAVDPIMFPACLSNVIAVGAATDNGTVLPIHPTWPVIDVLAPGVGIKGPVTDGTYGRADGSSFAAAQVSGAIALYKQRRPNASPAEIRRRLTSTGTVTEMRPGLKRRFLQVDKFLGIRLPAGAVRPDCFEPHLDASGGTVRGYFHLRCSPGTRLDRIAVTLDGPGVNLEGAYRAPDPNEPLDWYLERPLLVGPPAAPGGPGGYRLCALLYTKAQPVWPAATVCRDYEV